MIEGIPVSDGNENSEVVFEDLDQAMERKDVTEMTKIAISMYLKGETLKYNSAYTQRKGLDYALYGAPL